MGPSSPRPQNRHPHLWLQTLRTLEVDMGWILSGSTPASVNARKKRKGVAGSGLHSTPEAPRSHKPSSHLALSFRVRYGCSPTATPSKGPRSASMQQLEERGLE